MSLPNYLAKIKSAGIYRFTFDKSQVPPQAAETMRLVVGYSDKGPFNNPVYIDNKQDFINLFGNVNKRLEKKGIFFHRLALQALSAGPILALNLKPFKNSGDGEGVNESVEYVSIDPSSIDENVDINISQDHNSLEVIKLYDTDRFWKIDADKLAVKINTDKGGNNIYDNIINKYINIAATDVKDMSCSLFIRPCNRSTASMKQYDVTVRDWYMNNNETMPEYLEGFESVKISDFFAEVYVFRGEFSDAIVGEDTNGNEGPLAQYFDYTTGVKSLKTDFTNIFGQKADTLNALASDPNSNFIGVYRGSLLPFFKDYNGRYVSLDIVFNADKDTHKMIMKLDDNLIDYMMLTAEDATVCRLLDWKPGVRSTAACPALCPIYLKGYDYNTISKLSSAATIHDESLKMLATEGIFTALTNHVDSEYHYIIDTYASQITRGFGEKINICNVAKEKDNCLAIMNFPSVADIAKVVSGFKPSELYNFSDDISMPSNLDGASYCAFYTPLVFGDGTVKHTIPSAALVSNNFMEKWNSRQPYYIVAGPNYGRMEYEGLIGPDYNYGRADLDAYEPFGINCMVYVPRKGTYINSNQTAMQKPVSALSKVHVRELVIYLQDEIEAMLQNYQWEMNTQTLRDTVKTKADAILEKIKANGGVYEYINVCDGTNNTPEVIDNEMIILDTSIEPARGAGKMVQRLTIHRTGGISSLTK
jgi:hypothetical protein